MCKLLAFSEKYQWQTESDSPVHFGFSLIFSDFGEHHIAALARTLAGVKAETLAGTLARTLAGTLTWTLAETLAGVIADTNWDISWDNSWDTGKGIS